MDENKPVRLNPKPFVSANTIQVLKKHKLELSGEQYVNAWMDVSTNEKKLHEVLEAIYVDKFTDVKIMESVDLEKVQEDIQDFLQRWLIGSKRLKNIENN